MGTTELGRVKKICSNLGKTAVAMVVVGLGLGVITVCSVRQYGMTDAAMTTGVLSALSLSGSIIVMRVYVQYCERLEYIKNNVKKRQEYFKEKEKVTEEA